MASDEIVFDSYVAALASLQEVLAMPYNDVVRDATIQRFEYCMELSWKTLKRFLKVVYAVDEAATRELFRKAERFGLIHSSAPWITYLEKRNLTSHTYNKDTAQDVFGVVQSFYEDSMKLLEAMKNGYARHNG